MREKEMGHCMIDKLWAICLLEADFNGLLVYLFARQMMRHMRTNTMVSVEQMAAKGKVAIDGVMRKQLFYDDSCTLHTNAAISSTDAANCYDAVNHPVCSLALQAMSMPLCAVQTYL